MSDQRPTAGFWGLCGLVIVGLLVFYPVSLGPSGWLSSRFGGEEVVTAIYRPLTWTAIVTNSALLKRGIDWYAELGAAKNWHWVMVETCCLADPEHIEWEWLDDAPPSAGGFF